MLRFLFPGLTASPNLGERLFASATAEARRPHWYADGGVPDTLDGRFRMLATVVALVLVRLERAGETGHAASVALTERFAEVMESEHRQLGLGDPKLGRTVRHLVSALSRRVDLWRAAVTGERSWADAVLASVYTDTDSAPAAVMHSADALRSFSSKLEALEDWAVGQGELS